MDDRGVEAFLVAVENTCLFARRCVSLYPRLLASIPSPEVTLSLQKGGCKKRTVASQKPSSSPMSCSALPSRLIMNSSFNTSLPKRQPVSRPLQADPATFRRPFWPSTKVKKALAERLKSDNLLDRLLQRLSVRLALTLSSWGGRTQTLQIYRGRQGDEDTGRGHITRSRSRSTERES